ncbi:phosphopantetheine-binding protein [Vallitaleaceae bacterium 9-2]
MDEKKLLEIIAEFTTYEADDIDESMDFVDDLGIDSLDLAQIILSAESAFDVDLEDDMMENVSTVGDAMEMLRNRIEEME